MSDRTKLSVGVAGALSICVCIIGATWAVRGYLEDWKGELTDHFAHIESAQSKIVTDLTETKSAISYRVTEAQMVLWASQLDKLNRQVTRKDNEIGLVVPDPSTIMHVAK